MNCQSNQQDHPTEDKACEILGKYKQELFTRKKNGETRTKRALDYFRMPKL